MHLSLKVVVFNLIMGDGDIPKIKKALEGIFGYGIELDFDLAEKEV